MMHFNSKFPVSRDERLLPTQSLTIIVNTEGLGRLGTLDNISCSGAAYIADTDATRPGLGDTLETVSLVLPDRVISCGSATVTRLSHVNQSDPSSAVSVGLAFATVQTDLPERLHQCLRHYPYVSDELERGASDNLVSELDAREYSPVAFFSKRGSDLFAKCDVHARWTDDLKIKKLFQRLYRVTVTGGLDSRVVIFDPLQRKERLFICYDSNSYLGLHIHPRVVERVLAVVRQTGYGMPSAQVLSGTHRYLRELEVALSDFHGREETVIFPTGYAANMGVFSALIRPGDAVVRDQFAHASIHDGCSSSMATFNEIFDHNDPESLDTLLAKARQQNCHGMLVATDGVFSMHGRLANLPQLAEVCKRHGAKFLVDDVHGVGVVGETGRGIEEHFHMIGCADIFMGALSKTLGAIGGYVSASRNVITYLRAFAGSGMFTTSLPPAICAGALEALNVIKEEPEHRQRLWENVRYFAPALRNAGFITSDPISPIVTVFIGIHPLMWEFGRELFDAGIKCGNVMYPAVPRDSSILRLSVNARHTREDLEQTVDILTKIGNKFGILHKTEQEIYAIGRKWFSETLKAEQAVT